MMRYRTPIVILFCLCSMAVAVASTESAVWSQQTERHGWQVTLSPRDGPVRIGSFQTWEIHLFDAQGRPIYPARLAVDGGMVAHGHGLPTRPQVTRYLGNGRYLLEGIKFNMAGVWQMLVVIETAAGRDLARFELSLTF